MPAGQVEKGETIEYAGVRETEEECGAKGEAAEYIGVYRDHKNMSDSFFYLLDDGFTILPPDKYEEGLVGRDRKWFSEEDALAIVPKEQKELLKKGLEIYKKKHNLK